MDTVALSKHRQHHHSKVVDGPTSALDKTSMILWWRVTPRPKKFQKYHHYTKYISKCRAHFSLSIHTKITDQFVLPKGMVVAVHPFQYSKHLQVYVLCGDVSAVIRSVIQAIHAVVCIRLYDFTSHGTPMAIQWEIYGFVWAIAHRLQCKCG